MSEEQINIAIAEACGWWGNIKLIDGIPFGRPPKITSEYIELPDYCGDLNAMHEAEKTLTLQQLVDMQILITHFEGILPFHSTAHQRAEAFLRTIGKWKEAAK